MPTNPGPKVSLIAAMAGGSSSFAFDQRSHFVGHSFDVLEFKKFLVDAFQIGGRKKLIA
jgi:hypothetical protein